MFEDSVGRASCEKGDRGGRFALLSLCAVGIVCAPRLLRWVWPYANLADEAIYYLPYLVTRGVEPYVGFQCPYNPGSVWLLGFSYMALTPSYQVAEVLTLAIILAQSALIYLVGKRVFGGFGAVAAAALYAWHPLVMAYHVFANEHCVSCLSWLAIFWLVRHPKPSRRGLVLVGTAMVLACLFKKSAVGPAMGIAAYLLLARRDWRAAFLYTAMWSFAILAVTAFLTARYGEAYLQQTLIFHWVKGQAHPLWARAALFLRKCSDPVSLVGVAGLAMYLIRRPRRPEFLLILAVFIAEALLTILLSVTYWSHTHIPVCGYLAFFGGYLAASVKSSLGAGRLSPSVRGPSRLRRALLVTGALMGVLLILIGEWPLRSLRICHLPWGFGGIARRKVRVIADYVRRHSRETDLIFAPGFVALESHRRKIVDNVESAGVFAWLDETMRKEGLAGALRRSRGRSFWGMIGPCRRYWVRRVERAFEDRRIKVAVFPRDWSFEYPKSIRTPGYRLAWETERYRFALPDVTAGESGAP